MALVRVALVLVLTGIAFNEVSSFPKILELSLKEKQPEKELGKESSAIQIKNSEKELDPLDEDEESIARKILDRVPLIDGFVNNVVVVESMRCFFLLKVT